VPAGPQAEKVLGRQHQSTYPAENLSDEHACSYLDTIQAPPEALCSPAAFNVEDCTLGPVAIADNFECNGENDIVACCGSETCTANRDFSGNSCTEDDDTPACC